MNPEHSHGSAVGWALLLNMGQRGLSMLAAFVIAAILGPKDWGIAALAIVYIMFIQLILEQGVGPAVIQRKDLNDLHLDSAFWMMVSLSITLTGGSLALSELWATFYESPILSPLIQVLSALFLLHGLSLIQAAVLERNLDFKDLAIRRNASAIFGAAVGITCALSGAGLWSIVAQKLSESALALVLLWSLSSWRPRFRFSRTHAQQILDFSTKTFITRLSSFFENQASTVLIGSYIGPTAVGLYRMGEQAPHTIFSITTRSVHQVALPEYSRLQHAKDELRRSVLRSIRTSTLISFPALTLLAIASPSLMAAIGAEWQPAVAVVIALCPGIAAYSLTVFSGALALANARPGLFARVSVFVDSLTVAGIATAVMAAENAPIDSQILGVAAMRSALIGIVYAPLALYLYRRFAELRLGQVLGATGPAALVALVGGVIGFVVSLVPFGAGQPWLSFVAIGVSGGLAMFGVAYLVTDELRGLVAAGLGLLRTRRT